MAGNGAWLEHGLNLSLAMLALTCSFLIFLTK